MKKDLLAIAVLVALMAMPSYALAHHRPDSDDGINDRQDNTR